MTTKARIAKLEKAAGRGSVKIDVWLYEVSGGTVRNANTGQTMTHAEFEAQAKARGGRVIEVMLDRGTE